MGQVPLKTRKRHGGMMGLEHFGVCLGVSGGGEVGIVAGKLKLVPGFFRPASLKQLVSSTTTSRLGNSTNNLAVNVARPPVDL